MTPPDTDRVHVSVVLLQSQLGQLSERLDEIEEKTISEHRKVHDIVVATSEAIRNLTRTVEEIKPLTDDYREKRAEARGAARLAGWLYTAAGVVGGAVFFAASRIAEWLSLRPPGPPHP